LYAKSMTTRDLVDTSLISTVTESVLEKIHEWQSRPLDEVYPIVYLDCLVVKIHQDKHVINKAIYPDTAG